MDNNKKNKKSVFDDRRFVLLISVIIAFLAWIVVAGFIQPGETQPINEIPIAYTRNEQNYKNIGLIIVSAQEYDKANAMVEGNSNFIKNLSSLDVSIYPDYKGVTGPGVYDVPLRYEKIADGSYEIIDWGVGKNYEKTITMEFEELVTKVFEIEVKADDIEVAEGFFPAQRAKTDKQEIEISGAASVVNRIETAAAVIELDEKIVARESLSFENVPIKFFDESGTEIDVSTATVSATSTHVEITILQEGILKLGIDFTGTRNNFNLEWLESKMKMSASELHIAARSDVMEALPETYNIGIIDVSTIADGTVFEFPIELPERVENRENIELVTVSFDLTKLSTLTTDVRDVRIVNAPSGKEITVVDERVPSVTIMGDTEQIEAILPENIVLQVDALAVKGNGRQEIPARVLITKFDKIFAIGTYQIMCEVSDIVE